MSATTPEWILVSPDTATEWLGFNTHNRNVRTSWVDKLAETLVDYHPAPIVRNCDGTLLDGQHRLMAIVKSGTPRWMLVVNNVPAEIQNIIDTGKTRSSGDVLGLNGFQNRNNLASAARFCMILEADSTLRNTSPREITPADILAYVEAHPELVANVEAVLPVARKATPRFKQPTASKFAVARLVISRAYGEAFADAFLRSLILGVDINEDSVIYVTRLRLLSISTGKDAAIGLDPHKNARMAYWMVLRAAVAHRNGEQLRKILYRSDATPLPINLDGTINKEFSK